MSPTLSPKQLFEGLDLHDRVQNSMALQKKNKVGYKCINQNILKMVPHSKRFLKTFL